MSSETRQIIRDGFAQSKTGKNARIIRASSREDDQVLVDAETSVYIIMHKGPITPLWYMI